jgi:hypothetical protein
MLCMFIQQFNSFARFWMPIVSRIMTPSHQLKQTCFMPSSSSIRSVAIPKVEVGMSEFEKSDFEMSEFIESGFGVLLGASTRFCQRFEISDFSEKFSNKLFELSEEVCSC